MAWVTLQLIWLFTINFITINDIQEYDENTKKIKKNTFVQYFRSIKTIKFLMICLYCALKFAKLHYSYTLA